jgi:ABC-type branched-subunit amino acid transport system substrate-binding protein
MNQAFAGLGVVFARKNCELRRRGTDSMRFRGSFNGVHTDSQQTRKAGFRDQEKAMSESIAKGRSLTGPLSFAGIANANVATMVIQDINATGGLLGRQIELIVEDGATTDSLAAAKAKKLVEQDHVDVIFGGIYSSTRQAIKGPAVEKGRTLYIYPEQYEGNESDPLIFCTGPVPAQQVEPLIPWLMRKTGAKKFFLPSADYIWPHTLNRKVRELVEQHGGTIVGEEYYPLDHTDYRETVARDHHRVVMIEYKYYARPVGSRIGRVLYFSGIASFR